MYKYVTRVNNLDEKDMGVVKISGDTVKLLHELKNYKKL